MRDRWRCRRSRTSDDFVTARACRATPAAGDRNDSGLGGNSLFAASPMLPTLKSRNVTWIGPISRRKGLAALWQRSELCSAGWRTAPSAFMTALTRRAGPLGQRRNCRPDDLGRTEALIREPVALDSSNRSASVMISLRACRSLRNSTTWSERWCRGRRPPPASGGINSCRHGDVPVHDACDIRPVPTG